MNTIREIEKINQEELDRGLAGTSASWHAKYQHAAWVYVGNLDHELTEGDIISVMSQYGEIEDINLVREEDTGKSRGFAFVKYEDTRSCILAVDNFTGTKLLGRPMRVDHVENYRLPKDLIEKEEAAAAAAASKDKASQLSLGPGHAYQDQELANDYSLHQGQDLFAKPQQPRKLEIRKMVLSSSDSESSRSNRKRKRKSSSKRNNNDHRNNESRSRSKSRKRERKERKKSEKKKRRRKDY